MKKTLTIMLLTASLIVNALFLYNRLEKKVYMAGAKKTQEALYQKILNEVITKKRLIVESPKGRIVLVPQTKKQSMTNNAVSESDPNKPAENE